MLERLGRIALAVALPVLWTACGPPPPPPPPTEAELELMTRSLLVEALLQDFSGVKRTELSERYYRQLHLQLDAGPGDLEALRARYAESPELWVAASDSVVARLERHRTDPEALLGGTLD